MKRNRFLILCFLCFIPLQACGQTAVDYAIQRRLMVKNQLASRDISNLRVLRAMGKVERHLFVPPDVRERAYGDSPLPIGHRQTISQPYIVALMTQYLGVEPDDLVLEIGTGSGYQAAVLAELCREVYTIEIVEPLAKESGQRLRDLGYDNVHVRYGDGFEGWPEKAPFTKMIITAAAPKIPEPLKDQLAEGGRMILPLKTHPNYETLMIGTKREGEIQLQRLSEVRFVPMTGRVRDD